jgi:predicted heme/steroid binding protein
MTTLTLEELKKYDGQEGRAAYVAFQGQVYDLSAGASWAEGNHYDEHFAGQDLTEAMDYAPHGEEVLAGFPVVGELGQ